MQNVAAWKVGASAGAMPHHSMVGRAANRAADTFTAPQQCCTLHHSAPAVLCAAAACAPCTRLRHTCSGVARHVAGNHEEGAHPHVDLRGEGGDGEASDEETGCCVCVCGRTAGCGCCCCCCLNGFFLSTLPACLHTTCAGMTVAAVAANCTHKPGPKPPRSCTASPAAATPRRRTQ